MDGILIVNKPEGLTSFDVVAKVRKLAKTKKVGHTGTLDPMARGVLPIVVGNATRLSDIIMSEEKEYIAGIRFGKSYDTLDITGKVKDESSYDEIKNTGIFDDEVKLKEVLDNFKGPQMQVPPMYSAIKKDGVKMYTLARAGIEVELDEREIEIKDIELISSEFPEVVIKVNCSKGTYIRSLIRDIGKKLGLECAMSSLIRSRSGRFTLENSVNFDSLTEDNIEKNLISIEKILDNFETCVFDEKFISLLMNGVRVKDKRVTSKLKDGTVYRLYTKDKVFKGLIKYEEGAVTQFFRVN